MRGILRVADFRRLWIAMSLSSFGDWLGLLAISALATELADGYRQENFALGGVLFLRFLPAVIFGPLAGAFVDRFDRRYTMVVCDLIRFGLFVSIPLVGSLTWLFIAQFLIECASLFWIPAKDASVPNLVRRDQVESANQLSLTTTYSIAPVSAAIVFTLLAALVRELSERVSFFDSDRVNLALYINGLTFLVSAITVFWIRKISLSRQKIKAAGQPGFFRLLRDGWIFVQKTRMVRGLLIGILGAFAAGGTVIGTGKIYAESLGAGDAAYGALFGAVFIGLGLGMLLGPRVARDFSRRRLFGLSIVLAGACLILVAVMPHIALALLCTIGVGFGAGVAYLSGITLLGTEVDDTVRGRTFALMQSLVRVDLLLTLAAVPFLVGLLRQHRFDFGSIEFVIDGTRILLAIAGLLAIGVGIISYRQMDDRRGVPLWRDLITALRGDTIARRKLSHGGAFIAFEGGDGAGKSTQIRLLADHLRAAAIPVSVTYEPGATALGGRLRSILLDSSNESATPRAEALLFAADRAHHVDTVIRPALDAGSVVLTDRYVDASLAYQGAGRSLPVDEIRRLSRWATSDLAPDLTILLDIDPVVGLKRARGRGQVDRLELESLAFHQRVRNAFLAFAENDPDRYLVLDATRDPDSLAEAVRHAVAKVLADRLQTPLVGGTDGLASETSSKGPSGATDRDDAGRLAGRRVD